MKSLLELRKEMKRSRPKFLRTHYGALPRLAKTWRAPTGIHNKLRHKIFGRPISVTVGYRSPAAVRGLDRNGLVPVRINKPSDASYLDAKKHSAIIANVGMKNRLAILGVLKEKGISVLNWKNIDDSVKRIQEKYSQRIDASKKLRQSRAAAAKEREIIKPKQASKQVEKPAEKQEKQEDKQETQHKHDEKTEQEVKKEQEKKELDKMLIRSEQR